MLRLIACSVAALVAAQAFAAGPPLLLEKKIMLGPVEGRIDHMAYDAKRGRLIVAELGNDSVAVIDLDKGALVKRFTGLKGPQGVAIAADIIHVAHEDAGTVLRFRADGFAPAGRIVLGDDADNMRVDEKSGEVVVGYGEGALAFINAGAGVKTNEVRLAAHPESFQLSADGKRIYANVPNAREIAVIDRAGRRQVDSWRLPEAAANFAMALDDAGGRLLVIYRRPAMLVAFDTATGKPRGQAGISGDADDVFWDARRRRAYISCGEGFLDVVQRADDGWSRIARITTNSGARTALFVPERDRLYLAVRARGAERAAIWVYKPE